MKNVRAISAGIALILILAFGLLWHSLDEQSTSACGVYHKDKIVTVSHQTLDTEVASTSGQREKGLSGRPCILPNQAMLFIFETPNQYKMWMKGMNFSIDIIWISADHKAVKVERDVSPSTYPDMFVNNQALAKYVLEVKANRSSELGITIGVPIEF